MILTVCPNPCIDCTIEVENLDVGRLSRIDNKIENCAGKACNTAIGIARLGEKVFATGFLFEQRARTFLNYLDRENVPCEFVMNKGAIRVNYKIIDSKSMLTELNDSGDTVTQKKQEELLSLLERVGKDAAVTVISGSLPKGVAADYYNRLVSAAKGYVIVDCEGEKLSAALKAGVYMVKPNLYELETFNKENYFSHADMLKGCYKILNRGAQKVLLSMGRMGAILTDGHKNLYCKSENVPVNSTVGAGDSMIAAASIALEKAMDDEEILRCAVAAGTASITTQGTSLFTKEKYSEIYKKLKIQEI